MLSDFRKTMMALRMSLEGALKMSQGRIQDFQDIEARERVTNF